MNDTPPAPLPSPTDEDRFKDWRLIDTSTEVEASSPTDPARTPAPLDPDVTVR